jgi:NADPH:quinone reductase-like Zn-dependent oxidoreductase
MEAVVIHETGDPDVLHVEEVEQPEPSEGEVLIGVYAASVNPIDWKQRRGLAETSLPAVLGAEVSGTVQVSRAPDFADGDEVFGMAPSGGYAEFATAPAAVVAKKPAGVSHEQAAALPVAGMTAWQALFDRGGLESGQTALIAGAAGGVGHLAVQFAKHAGARVIGTGSSRNRDFVLGLAPTSSSTTPSRTSLRPFQTSMSPSTPWEERRRSRWSPSCGRVEFSSP